MVVFVCVLPSTLVCMVCFWSSMDHSCCPVWFQITLVNYTQSLKLHPIDCVCVCVCVYVGASVCVPVCVSFSCWRHLIELYSMSVLINLNEVQLFLCFRHLGEVKWKCSCFVCVCVCVGFCSNDFACVCACWRKLLCYVWQWVRKSGCQLVSSKDTPRSEADAQSLSFHLSGCSKESLMGQNSDREAVVCQLVHQMSVIVGLGLWQ